MRSSLLALALAAAGCASHAAREPVSAVEAALATLTTDLGGFDAPFDAVRARPRILAILSPT